MTKNKSFTFLVNSVSQSLTWRVPQWTPRREWWWRAGNPYASRRSLKTSPDKFCSSPQSGGFMKILPGVYRVPYNLIFFLAPFFLNLDFTSPYPLSNLIFFPTAIYYYREDDIGLNLFPFFHVIFFPTALIFPSPYHNLIFFPNSLDKLPSGII